MYMDDINDEGMKDDNTFFTKIYVFIIILKSEIGCKCVCVCVCVWERERERYRETKNAYTHKLRTAILTLSYPPLILYWGTYGFASSTRGSPPGSVRGFFPDLVVVATGWLWLPWLTVWCGYPCIYNFTTPMHSICDSRDLLLLVNLRELSCSRDIWSTTLSKVNVQHQDISQKRKRTGNPDIKKKNIQPGYRNGIWPWKVSYAENQKNWGWETEGIEL